MILSGNKVLITGGATGIGFALAEAFLSAGSKVIICGRREDRLKESQDKLCGGIIKKCDVSEPDSRRELFEWAVKEHPELNILINNAGIQRDIDLSKGPEELMSGGNEIRINLEAPVYLNALFIPHLSGRENPAIINITSGLAFRPMPGVPIYCVTKTALHVYTQFLREQLVKTGIKVYEVIPPMVDTELNMEGRKNRNMPFKGMNAKEYADGVMKALSNDETEIRFGIAGMYGSAKTI